jgi:hypothetical protein
MEYDLFAYSHHALCEISTPVSHWTLHMCSAPVDFSPAHLAILHPAQAVDPVWQEV